MASDVVYYRSNRESLKKTIQAMCGPTTLVVLAHTWRTEPKQDQEFFDSLRWECGFEMYEVQEQQMPPGYSTRDSDGRLPISILLFWRPQ